MPPPMMPPGFDRVFHAGPPIELIVIELAYFLCVVGFSMYIYFKTREAYELTKHRGIHHFRNIFLYFAIALFFRLAHILNMLWIEIFGFSLPLIIIPLSLLCVSYFSTLAILSVLISVIFKEITVDERWLSLGLHGMASLSAIIVLFSRSNLALIMLQTGVFLAAVAMALLRSGGKGHQLSGNKITFVLLFIFWVLSTFALERRFIPIELKIPLYILSVIIFFSISLRVRKRLVHAEKKRSS